MPKLSAIHFLVAGLILQHITAASSSSCASGKFGQNCQFTCHCAGDATCTADGTCQACADGWEGHKCQIVKNIARGKTVKLSSTLAFWNRLGSLAVDGDSRRDFYGAASCVSTGKEQRPWLQIDLGQEYVVQQLTISTLANDLFAVLNDHMDRLHRGVDLFPDIPNDGSYAVNHTSCLLRCLSKPSAECKKVTSCDQAYSANGCWRVPDHDIPRSNTECCFNERLSSTLENLKVHVGGGLCKSAATTIAGDREETVSCDQTVVGRIVTLSLHNTDARPLALCEVKVKGYRFVECRRGYRGMTCDLLCSSCSSGGGCNIFTGTCCDEYKTGALCEKDLPHLKNNPWRTQFESSSITIKWNAWKSGDGVGPVNKYCLRVYKQGDTAAPPCVDVNTPSTSHTTVERRVGGLTHNTIYVFSVACYLTDGLGDVLGKPTEQITVKTSCRDPQPVNLHHNDVTSTQMPQNGEMVKLIVKWAKVIDSGCDIVKYYRVTADLGATRIRSLQVSGTQHIVTFTDLNLYTDYVIRVEAENNEGLTAVSNAVTHKTAQGFSGPVQGIRMQALGPDQLNVTWSTPSDPRGQITGYLIRHREVGIGDCDATVHSWSGWLTVTTRYHTIHELQPYRQYEVMVSPKNGFGAGKPTSIKAYTTQSVPTSYPRSVKITQTGKRSAQVAWDALPCGERNGKITSYKYLLQGLRFSSLDLTYHTDGTSPATQLAELTPFATYSFKVTPINGAGVGANFSQPLVFTTEEDVPPPPENVTFPYANSTAMHATWLAPYPPYGNIKIYEAMITNTQTGEYSRHQTSHASYNFVNLENNSKYAIKVRAKTEAGWGNWSIESYGATKQADPSESLELTLIRITNTSIIVYWDYTSLLHLKIKDYKVSCSFVHPDGYHKVVEVTVTKRYATVPGLQPDTLYTCAVQARTGSIHGQKSKSITVRTTRTVIGLDEPQEASVDPKVIGLAVLGVLCLLLGSAVIVVIVKWRNDVGNKKKETYTDLATIPKPDSTYSEIDVAEMPAYENAIAERRQVKTSFSVIKRTDEDSNYEEIIH